MDDISTRYNPAETEDKWYKYWIDNRFFESEPDNREPFCIVIPPPNVTGVLHMGHMLYNTIQDVLVRRARMMGKNALWVPGTDHASIATEAKVVSMLKEKGIDKKELTREKFLEYAWEWKEKHGGIILEQLKKLGASCDWRRVRFTMEDALYQSVIDVFVDLYEKGLIYRGVRMVNWDPKALTAISDEEVIFKEQKSKLYYLKYMVENSQEYVTVATTRPETILGDTAVCVHPNDKRYSHLIGKNVIVPVAKRVVPVILDEYVDMEFGTGAVKITPAHDINDYTIGIKHKLPVIDIFNDNGTLNDYGLHYKGIDRFECRKQISNELRDSGLMEREEDYINNVGCSERTDVVIEPKLSLQWFLKMEEISKSALEVVEKDIVRLHPSKFKNSYRHWMENIKDWCISRQLWWGHRIPAYYSPNGDVAIAKTKEEAFEKLRTKNNELKIDDVKQDEDVLDTWFSSWLWPISVFDGIRFPDNRDINYYYPTNDLITAPEILFFWVARMIIAGLEYRKEIPFKNVYLTGIVRDKIGRKMSKSLGNSPEPLDLIEKYGADGVRVGMLLSSPAGNDLLFEQNYCEQGRNFSNKIWNAFRLVKGWESADIPQPDYAKLIIEWFREKLNKTLSELNDDFDKYRLSECLMTVYKLIWDDFCSWFLETVKPQYQKPIDKVTLNQTIDLFEDLMKVLHPFMPFITEEIFQELKPRKDGESIMIALQPVIQEINSTILDEFAFAQEKIVAIRQIRNEKNIPQKNPLELYIKRSQNDDTKYDSIIAKLCNLLSINYIDGKKDDTISLIVRTTEMFIPLPQTINKEEELKKLNSDLIYFQEFAESVKKKLSNEKFVTSAPVQVVENERKKLTDAEQKIVSISAQIEVLGK